MANFSYCRYLPAYTYFLPRDDNEEKVKISYIEKKRKTKKSRGFLILSPLPSLVVIIMLLCITESENMKKDPLNFSVLNIIFEVISAYGNVGFSMGYSCERQLQRDENCSFNVGFSIDCPVDNLVEKIVLVGSFDHRVDQVQRPKNDVKSNGKIQENDSSDTEECKWGCYAKGALYALQRRGNHLKKGITGFICGTKGLDSSGLSSSAAVGIAYLLALESANNLTVSPTENIEYDRLIENEYLGLKNGILDQSAILLSSYGCLTFMDCKTKLHKLIHPPKVEMEKNDGTKKAYKILLAFSGLKQALTTNPGYNRRVAECRDAAKILLTASGKDVEPILCNVKLEEYEAHKSKLEPDLAKRAEHYFSENMRVIKGLEAWGCGNFEEFGKLISASGLSSIQNYECGCEPLIQIYNILVKAPGVYGARFSGAGFRGCCVAFVNAEYAEKAASYVNNEYLKVQPDLASHLNQDTVVICDSGDCARVI